MRVLGKKLPDVPFPHRNTKQEVLDRVMKSAFKDGQTAFMRMSALFVMIIVGLVIPWIR
jgi:hypothetical protein